ncbi:HNH endonuclease [Neotabrizicola sp. VNH66]|uniref:HNH endonuclease n=1 Tax=Neotabrizicola sp. VNH66 TaxID=3400918 RepID=UPI003C00CE06
MALHRGMKLESIEMLTSERLKELLTYDPITGLFRWRIDRGRLAKAGQVAGSPTPDLRTRIKIDGNLYLLHRLAFLYMTGAFPPDMVDHANGDPSDNRWCNLRPANRSQNMANRGVSISSRIGVKGVSAHGKRFRTEIRANGKRSHIGVFDTVAEAKAAYDNAANLLHGPFARSA